MAKTLRIKSYGLAVKKLQERLSALKLYFGAIDKDFGPKTQNAVKAFQQAHKLPQTGEVDDALWSKLFPGENHVPSEDELMPKEDIVFPILQQDLDDVYGDPEESKTENIVFIDLSPFQKYLDHVELFHWRGKFGFFGHKCLKPALYQALKCIIDKGLADLIETFDGCLNIRPSKGGRMPSTHSWGVALDFNASTNRFGQQDYDMDDRVIKCFTDAGFEAGAGWSTPDAMHFQLAWTRDWRKQPISEFRPNPNPDWLKGSSEQPNFFA